MKSLSLNHAILSTISFFDALSYPLTVPEIEESMLFFPDSVRTMTIINELNSLCFQGHIESSYGMYVLKGRADIIEERLAKYAPCEEKYRIARRVSRILAHIPFVRMICVVNSLAISNAQEDSDIDFFIVVKKNHIWFTRFFVVALLDMIRKRPKGNVRKNMICTCFFASEDALDFSSLQIHSSLHDGIPDVYLAWWVSRFVSMYDAGDMAEKLFLENEWAKKIFFHRRLYHTIKEHTVSLNIFGAFLKRVGEWCIVCTGRVSEFFMRAVQMRILPDSLRSLANRDTRVVINDRILKFHIRDTRDAIRAKFYDTCKSYGIDFFR